MIATFVKLFAVCLVMFLDNMLLKVLVGREGGTGTVTAFERSFWYVSCREIWYQAVAGSGKGAIQGNGGDVTGDWDGSRGRDGCWGSNDRSRTDNSVGWMLLLLDISQL